MNSDGHKSNPAALRESRLQFAQEMLGNPDKFGDYVKALRPKLKPVIAGILRNHPNEIEDALQESFIRIYNGLPGFNGNCALDTWSHTVAARKALGILRHLEKTLEGQNTSSLDDQAVVGKDNERIPFDVPARGKGQLDAALHKEQMGFIWDAVGSLSPDYQSVFMLRDIKGLSTEETAQALGVESLGTVKSRLTRARKMIKDHAQREMIRRGKVPLNDGAVQPVAVVTNGLPNISTDVNAVQGEITRKSSDREVRTVRPKDHGVSFQLPLANLSFAS